MQLKPTTNRYAYLVIAHKDDATFRTLLRLLDDARNDIFVHMDAKNASWDESLLGSLVKKAGCFAIPRISVTWGGYSLVDCELRLLEAATARGHYSFYHLLSGQDLPLKGQNGVHDFFDAHKGVEFVGFEGHPTACEERAYGHRLWARFGHDRSQKALLRLDGLWSKAEHALARRKFDFEFQKGDQWFSIGDECARYVLSRKDWIEETFRYAFAADEIFLQTVLWNSPFRSSFYRPKGEDRWAAIQRYIDWNRGNPHCFTYDDVELLRDSPLMFARKFDCEKDARVIEAVVSITKD